MGTLLQSLNASTLFLKVLRNAEISSLVRILGLKFGEAYNEESKLKTLRYGRLLIMTDQVSGTFLMNCAIWFALVIFIFRHCGLLQMLILDAYLSIVIGD